MTKSVIIYDGQCGFCTWNVLFVLRRPKGTQYTFTSTSSDYAQEFFSRETIHTPETIWLIDPAQQYYSKSSAVLRIIGRLGGIYILAYVGFIVPSFIRDYIYDFIARNRKKLLKNNACPVIPDEYKHQFLE